MVYRSPVSSYGATGQPLSQCVVGSALLAFLLLTESSRELSGGSVGQGQSTRQRRDQGACQDRIAEFGSCDARDPGQRRLDEDHEPFPLARNLETRRRRDSSAPIAANSSRAAPVVGGRFPVVLRGLVADLQEAICEKRCESLMVIVSSFGLKLRISAFLVGSLSNGAK
jgi:hypothetical protein